MRRSESGTTRGRTKREREDDTTGFPFAAAVDVVGTEVITAMDGRPIVSGECVVSVVCRRPSVRSSPYALSPPTRYRGPN